MAAAQAACLAIVGLAAGCGVMANGQNADGVRLYQQGAYQGAIGRFQQAVATNPDNADGYYNLACTYHRLAKVNNDPAMLGQAETLYHKCIDRNPDHEDCYRALAVLLVDQNRTDDAFALLDGWALRSPNNAAPRIEIARLHDEFGDRDKARESLVAALQLDPYNSRALTAMGKLHEDTGNPTQALADYERSLAQDRLQPDVSARVASLRSGMGTMATSTAPDGTRMVLAPPGVRR